MGSLQAENNELWFLVAETRAVLLTQVGVVMRGWRQSRGKEVGGALDQKISPSMVGWGAHRLCSTVFCVFILIGMLAGTCLVSFCSLTALLELAILTSP